jgi:hypothetical protein
MPNDGMTKQCVILKEPKRLKDLAPPARAKFDKTTAKVCCYVK